MILADMDLVLCLESINPVSLLGIFDISAVQSSAKTLITARKRSLEQGNMFTPVCNSVHMGGAWSGGCLVRGVPGPGGLPGPGGCLVLGGCLVETPTPDGHCCGWYASYCNAFLFTMLLCSLTLPTMFDTVKLIVWSGRHICWQLLVMRST